MELKSASAPTSSNLPFALAALGDKATAKVRKGLVAYMIAGAAVKVGKGWFEKAKAELLYGVAVQGDDDIYDDLHQWLLGRLPSARRKMLVARTGRRRDNDAPTSPSPTSAGPSGLKLRLYYDGSRQQVVNIDGHRVKVWVERPETQVMVNPSEMSSYMKSRERIIFQVQGVEGRDAVLGMLEDLTEAHGEHKTVRFFVSDKWGSWRRRQDMALRTLDTVVLQRGQKEELVADLQSYFDNEDQYNRLGIPWHRGLLLEGPPGTGKTSLAKALAVHFQLDLHYIPLASLEDDGALLGLMRDIEPRSILLLEDIDIVHGAKERDDTASGVTLSGLLNALDGLMTPAGLVTIMTSNNAAVIDPALTRPGRVDRTEHLGFIDGAQLNDLVEVALGRRIDLPSPNHDISPAEVVEVLKRNLGDEEATITALKELAHADS